NLKSEMLNIPKQIRDKITELKERKSAFFSGLRRSADLKELKEIEKYEQDIFKEIVEMKVQELVRKGVSLESQISALKSQKGLYGDERTKKEREQIKKLEEELAEIKSKLNKYQEVLQTIGSKTQKDYFFWELDFIEVFSQKGGFDIVIGNPPYVRQELIAPPLENKNNYTDDRWREIKKAYKEKLIQSVKNTCNVPIEIDRKSDLYVYFYYQGLSLLRPSGIFTFINSNSWLDVGYGAGLQEFLLKNMKPVFAFDNLKKRSFKQADVNTVIVVIQKQEQKPVDYPIKFVAFKKPFEEVNNAEVVKKIYNASQPIFDDEDFRIYPKTKKELLIEGVEIPEEEAGLLKLESEHLPYIGNKWGGKYLRAPEIYFKILEKGKDKLVRLGDIAEVRRGFTTGANEFFYLKPVGMSVKEVVEISEKNPDALIPVKNGAGWEGEIEARFLKPVIKSPRELRTIVVRLEDLNYLVFMCHEPKNKLKGTNALKYIEWGEKQGYQNRPTCRGRERWWDLGQWEISKNILPMFERERNYCFYNEFDAYIDAALYWCYTKENEVIINILLNSMLIKLWKELLCRPPEGGGGGPIQMKVYHYNEMPIPKKIIDVSLNNEFLDIFNAFINREILTIFTELGFDPNKPIREQEPNPLPDRKALDDIIFDALGLTEEERKEVYWAVAELVKTRLEKARSV
ncbi:MAG: hypothetical protein C0174_01630, partial [Thermodesulfobium narugense]